VPRTSSICRPTSPTSCGGSPSGRRSRWASSCSPPPPCCCTGIWGRKTW
jgi:hypothetical protein